MTNSTGAQKLTLPQIVDKATDDLLIGPDWGANMQFCDLLNSHPNHASEAIKLLTKKLKDSKSVHVQLLTIELITTLVKNCFCTNSIVANKDFHSTITKLLEKKKLNENVKFKLTDMIQSFALSFRSTEWRTQFENLYSSLRKQGIPFPPPGNESIFSPPPPPGYTQRHTPNKEPQRFSHDPESKPAPKPAPKPVPKANMSRDSFNSAREAAQLLSEILSNVESKEELKDNDVATEIYGSCKEHQKTILGILETGEVTDESQLENLLQLNDQLIRVVSRYDAAMKGEIYKPALLAAPKNDLLEFFQDDSQQSQNTQPTQHYNHPPKTHSQEPPKTQDSFFDSFMPSTSHATAPPSHTTTTTHTAPTRQDSIPLLSAPPSAVKTRNPKKTGSLTSQSTEQLQNQLHSMFLDDKQKPSESDPFMAIALRDQQNTAPNVYNSNPFINVTTNPGPVTTNHGPAPTNFTRGPTNPGPMTSFPGPLPPYNPQLIPQTGMPMYHPQPFPGNFPGPMPPQQHPYQYGQHPPMQFPPPPQFYYAVPPNGMPPVNPHMNQQPAPGKAPNTNPQNNQPFF